MNAHATAVRNVVGSCLGRGCKAAVAARCRGALSSGHSRMDLPTSLGSSFLLRVLHRSEP